MMHDSLEANNFEVIPVTHVTEALNQIATHADEVIVKPCEIKELTELIRKRMLKHKPSISHFKVSVASILERDADTIQRWLSRGGKTEISEGGQCGLFRQADGKSIRQAFPPDGAAKRHCATFFEA
jgi:hypothetical protein